MLAAEHVVEKDMGRPSVNLTISPGARCVGSWESGSGNSPFVPPINRAAAWMNDVSRRPLFCTQAYSLMRTDCTDLTGWIGRQAYLYAIAFMFRDGMRGHPRLERFPMRR